MFKSNHSIKSFLAIAIFTIFFSSCHKDEETFTSEDTSTFTAVVEQEITGTIYGYIYDEANNPVADATVAIYSTTIKTSSKGVFIFDNVKMDKQGTFIKASKNGFILGSDLVYPSDKASTYSYIKMMALENDKSFEAKTGGTVQVTNGGTVVFPADAIVKANGDIYTGNVSTTAKYLNPSNPDLDDLMPGGLIADAADKRTVVLGTLGMVAVELRGSNGEELNLAPGKKATINFPVTTSYQPETIALWSFDEAKGRWQEEGTAVKKGNFYVAEVSHFSFWNCDAPFPLIHLCGSVVTSTGSPIVNATVRIEVEGLNAGWGVTNEKGEFCGKVPKGKTLKITIYYKGCDKNVYEGNIGPFNENVTLDKIIVTLPEQKILKGTIVCGTNPVAKGLVVVEIEGRTLIFNAGENGKFDFDLTSNFCKKAVDFNIFGINTETNDASTTINYTSVANAITIDVCASGCNITGDLVYNCKDSITVKVTGGSGNFKYDWNNGITQKTKSIKLQNDSTDLLYCVTITDLNNNCEKIVCKEIGGQIYIFNEINCNVGEIELFITGGSKPYKYLWSNGETTAKITLSSQSTYTITVTDIGGCSATKSFVWEGQMYINPNPQSCSKNMYMIDSSPFDIGFDTEDVFGAIYQFPLVINVFTTDFSPNINLNKDQCSISETVRLPRLIEGLTATPIATTCGTCNDGTITVSVNNQATCSDCTVGDTKIFSTSDLNTDLSASNTNNTLPKGDYYVVVTDKNTGCYIAFKKVTIK